MTLSDWIRVVATVTNVLVISCFVQDWLRRIRRAPTDEAAFFALAERRGVDPHRLAQWIRSWEEKT